MNYKLGSLFDGSGGFPLAGVLCGIEPMWAAEVEPYPIAVTSSRFPKMKHLGDISKVNGAEIEPVDIITFGSPCQDLSVAGKRAGLKHEANGDEETTRSGLFMEAVRIIKEMRKATNGQYPRFALWENVPGAFSSNKGEDFRVVCEELIKIIEPSAFMPPVPKNGWNYSDSYSGDGWSLAYRVLDAQYWGVPQRRRRIYLVADFRGECAREVLFERQGLRGYFAEGRTPWQTTPADAQGSTGADDPERATAGGRGRQLDAVGVINAIGGNAENSQETDTFPTLTNGTCPGFNNAVAVPYTMKIRSGCAVDSAGKAAGKGALIQKDKAATLSTVQDQYLFQPMDPTFIIDNVGGQAEYAKASEVNGTLRAGAQGLVAYSFDSLASNSMKSKNPHSGCREVEVAKTLDTTDPNPSKNQGGLAVVQPVSKVSIGLNGEQKVSPTLIARMETATGTTQDNLVICLQGNGIDRADTAGCNGKGWNDETCYTLNTIDRPAVAYSINHQGGNTEQIIEEKTGTLTAAVNSSGNNKLSVAYGLDRASFNQGQNAKFDFSVQEEQQPTLTARGPGAVCCTTGSYMQTTEEVSPTHMARDWKDPTCVCANYIVRRLTPTECARLQGFADWWGIVEPKDTLTDEEYLFWLEVRNTHAAINGRATKDYTPKAMLSWYNKLYTDSAEYKMWGNGIALPTALYCMQGVVDALNTEEDDESWML